MSYRLLVIDIDGTLVDGNKNISTEDRAALAKARDLGVQVSLSTGRAARACLGIINQLSLDGYHIFFDGATVSSPIWDKEIYVRPLSKEIVKQAVDFARQHEIDLELYSSTHYFAERETWSTQAHRQFFNIEPHIVDFTDIWLRERIVKGGLVTTNPEEVAKAKIFCVHFDDSLHFSRARTPAYPGIDFVNILAPDVSKGKALEALAVYLEIPVSAVMAVGDGLNDIPLLTAAGLGVAMDNATDEVKAVADHITLGVEHSGLAAAIKKFLL